MHYLVFGPEPPGGPDTLPAPTNEQYYAFYSLFGATIASWQFVEAGLFLLFGRATKQPGSKPLAAAFHTPPGFRTRLDMVEAALAEVALSEDIRAEWTRLYNRAKKAAGRRNRLAHSIVGFDASRPYDNQLFIVSNVLDPTRFKYPFDQKDIISIKELKEMQELFAQLRSDLTVFAFKV